LVRRVLGARRVGGEGRAAAYFRSGRVAVCAAAAPRCAVGRGRAAARARAARRQFQSCQTEALNLDDAGAGPRFSF